MLTIKNAADIEKMVSEQKDSVMNGIGTLARRQFPDIDEFRDGIGDLYDEIANRISDYFTDRSVLGDLNQIPALL